MSKRDTIPSSGNNDWETPWDVFHDWHSKFHFTLDVCASDKNAKCDNYFTLEHNGLIQPWHDRNWCNPPYGRGMILPFVAKAHAEAKEGHLIVALLPVATSTKWWQQYVAQADYVYFYPHRINFLRNGVVVRGVAFDPCIVIWGLNPLTK